MKNLKEIYYSIKKGWITGFAISKEQKGKFDQAIDLYIRAINYSTDETSKATLIESISNIYYKLGRYEEALKYAEGAQDVYERRALENEFFNNANIRILENMAAMRTANQKIKQTENTSD